MPRSAGGFIWALVDESVARDDRGGALDTAGNQAPDGIVGPYREREGSFATIRDIWSPVQLTNLDYYNTKFPASFDGTVRIVNRYDFTNLSRCGFGWQLVTFAAPGDAGAGHTVTAQGTVAGPDVAPGTGGVLALGLPANWSDADALRVSVTDPTGRLLNTWTWTIRKAVDHVRRLVVPAPGAPAVTATETPDDVVMTAETTTVSISRTTGRLTAVTRDGVPVSLANGPALSVGTATLTRLTHQRDGTGWVVQAGYSGDLISVRWRLDANGWLRLDYRYNRTGDHDFLGVNLDYPESRVRGVTWLGHGPFRVWKNRMRGVTPDVWTKAYNNTATGATGFDYPEFKGYHANTYWAALRTTEGTITIVSAQENLFLRLFTPRFGPTPRNTIVPFPAGGISLLDGIPAVGNKFHAVSGIGPESQPNVARGDYQRTCYFRFTP
ncbi:MAG TPA: hypothetical protein VF755_10515 [Catenuloplanes sp.]|jgi:hypothetical protein